MNPIAAQFIVLNKDFRSAKSPCRAASAETDFCTGGIWSGVAGQTPSLPLHTMSLFSLTDFSYMRMLNSPTS